HVSGQGVRVEPRRGDHRQDRSGLRVQGDDGAAPVPECVGRGPLGVRVDRQLDGPALRLVARDERLDPLEQQRAGGAVEHLVLTHLQPGESVVRRREVPRDVAVELTVRIDALVLVVVIDRLGTGDRLTGDDDRSAVAAVLAIDRPHVARIGVESVGLEELDRRRPHHEREEHDDDNGRQTSDRAVHSRTTSVLLSSPGPGPPRRPGSPGPSAPSSGRRPPSSVIGSSGGAGRRAEAEIRSSKAMMIQLETSEEPPAARNGAVSPVTGMIRVMPPTTTKTWKAKTNAIPEAKSLPNPSRTPIPARMPRSATMRYRSRMTSSPTKPSSSPSAAMMKPELA